MCIIILIDTELKLVLTLKNKEKNGFFNYEAPLWVGRGLFYGWSSFGLPWFL